MTTYRCAGLTGTFLLSLAVCFAVPPTVTKAFTPSTIFVGDISTITFTIINPNPGFLALTAISDVFPGLNLASLPILSCTAPGPILNSSSVLSNPFAAFQIINQPGGATCTVTFDVRALGAGSFMNFATAISSDGASPVTSATLTVYGLTLSKMFGAASMGVGGTTALSFTLNNPTAVPVTGFGFVDTLPAGLIVSTPDGLTGSCGGGAISAVAGSNTISLSAATLAAGASCTFSVNVTATGAATGVLTNTTDPVLRSTVTVGAPAAASIAILVNGSSLVSYIPNLNLGDSFVNITNAGTLGAGLPSGTTASITGAICANVYVFSSDEQMISCCSCPVTPNGLVSLSGKEDLLASTLTPAVPSSITVKLIATVPVNASCNNSAAGVSAAGLAPGIHAWGTRLHTPAVGSGTPQVTETPFTPDTLSPGELTRLQSLCTFIQANGSGYGTCRSCRPGAMGADRK